MVDYRHRERIFVKRDQLRAQALALPGWRTQHDEQRGIAVVNIERVLFAVDGRRTTCASKQYRAAGAAPVRERRLLEFELIARMVS